MSKINPIVFIVGPTAVGKSNFAVTAAKELSAGIVNCDSLQFFTDLNIGTAKPTKLERTECPHYLFDIKGKGEEFTAGQYRKKAAELVDEKRASELLFFVGGSGFYIQALDKGMYDVEPISQEIEEAVQRDLDEFGLEKLYAAVKEVDPEYASKIAPQDQYRVFRATTLIRSHNKSVTEIQKEFAEKAQENALPGPKIKIGFKISKEVLRQRVEQRLENMIEDGLLTEVRDLLDEGYASWAPMRSVGYKETVDYINGEYDEETWQSEIVKNTMQLAKRQMTWFKRDPEIEWFDGEESWDKPLSFLRDKIIMSQKV